MLVAAYHSSLSSQDSVPDQKTGEIPSRHPVPNADLLFVVSPLNLVWYLTLSTLARVSPPDSRPRISRTIRDSALHPAVTSIPLRACFHAPKIAERPTSPPLNWH